MPIGNTLLKPAFDILNFEIKILISNNGDMIKIPLYAVVILLFIVEFIIILWQSFMSAEGHGFGETTPYDYTERKTYIDTDGVITGYAINERKFKVDNKRRK